MTNTETPFLATDREIKSRVMRGYELGSEANRKNQRDEFLINWFENEAPEHLKMVIEHYAAELALAIQGKAKIASSKARSNGDLPEGKKYLGLSPRTAIILLLTLAIDKRLVFEKHDPKKTQ